jgi:hypothetical protein
MSSSLPKITDYFQTMSGPSHPAPRKAMLLIYRRIDFLAESQETRFVHTLTNTEVEDAIESFRNFPELVTELTHRQIFIESEIVLAERILATLTATEPHQYWPSPDDTRLELDTLAPPYRYDSVFVLWPQNNLTTGSSISSPGWGLAIAAGPWSNWATYATVANAHSATWKVPRSGEVWLHEWLHGVCSFFADRGFLMPDGDADGGGRHGYKQSPVSGWTDYYRDLMTGNVPENGQRLGIPLEAWPTWGRERS